ncbi:Transcriptional regulator KdgR [subsurface metagenome]
MKAKNSIKSLLKAVSVLKSFTPDELELGTAEISRKLGIPKTTAHRMLTSLSEGGLLEQNGKTGKFRIGLSLYTLGSLYLKTTDICIAAKPVIETVNDLTKETVNISILDRNNITLIMKEESKHAFRLATHIGSIIHAYASAMGKALLSELTEAEIDSLYPEEKLPPLTNKTISTKTELKRELEQIRKTGIAFDREGSYEGVTAIGSVTRNANGKAAAAMSIAVPVFRMNEANRKRLTTLVRLGVSLISYRLGYQDTQYPVRDIKEIYSWWKQNKLDSASQANDLSGTELNSTNVAGNADQV